MKNSRRTFWGFSLSILLGTIIGGFWLLRSVPDLRNEIDRRKTNRYCQLSLGRLALALHDARSPTGRFPPSLNDLSEPARSLTRCSAAPDATASYIYSSELSLDMPPGMILLHEQGLHHQIRGRQDKLVSCCFYVRLDLEVTPTIHDVDLVAQAEHSILAAVRQAPPEQLNRDLLDARRSGLHRALCAWRLGEQKRLASRPNLETALTDSSSDVRLQAAYALLKMGSTKGAAEVVRQLPSLNAVAARIARKMLSKLSTEQGSS